MCCVVRVLRYVRMYLVCVMCDVRVTYTVCVLCVCTYGMCTVWHVGKLCDMNVRWCVLHVECMLRVMHDERWWGPH